MKRFVLLMGISAWILGCGKDSSTDNPGVPAERSKNPNAPRGYGDPSTGPLKVPGQNGQIPNPGQKK